MDTTDSLEKFLAVELEGWRVQEKQPLRSRPGPVIGITRDAGCSGDLIAQKLASELGLVLYGWEIVERIAQDEHVSARVVATLDETVRSELENWLVGSADGASLSAGHYMNSLRKVLFAIAAHGHAVIMGRGANFLIPPESRTVGLRLIAPLHVKTANTMQALGLPEQSAQEHIAKVERAQRLWVRKCCHADIEDATNYHAVINTALVTPQGIVNMVSGMVRAQP